MQNVKIFWFYIQGSKYQLCRIWCYAIFDYDERWSSQAGPISDLSIVAIDIDVCGDENEMAEQKCCIRHRWRWPNSQVGKNTDSLRLRFLPGYNGPMTKMAHRLLGLQWPWQAGAIATVIKMALFTIPSFHRFSATTITNIRFTDYNRFIWGSNGMMVFCKWQVPKAMKRYPKKMQLWLRIVMEVAYLRWHCNRETVCNSDLKGIW